MDIATKITQDVLILHGKEDHFIHWRFHKKEVEALKNAKSLTLRFLTDTEQASDHCQCGNTQLALNTILNWLATVKKKVPLIKGTFLFSRITKYKVLITIHFLIAEMIINKFA